ncbi:MAG: UDP-3-O-acyl-N-acetylglucosamine deacetylase [Alkalinema sp. RU_4_3]|nr:UDP-3-O-acyl-N-acetylglucosamine deacetylase [Alkalinema sp. RU_4_3]
MEAASGTIAPGISGVGLHSGTTATVRLVPAPQGRGRYFVRTDLPGQPEIPATIALQQQTQLSTELVAGEARVRTVEHLLAALFAAGVLDVRIEIDGPEVPLLDGSAKPWWDVIAAHPELHHQTTPTPALLTEAIWIHQGDQFVAAIPSPELRFSYGIDFEVEPIGNQWHSWSPASESFGEAIAPARTFGLARQIDQLRSAGLIKGGSLDNALVCDQEAWINPPLRFSNEPVRHKLLDLVGDLSLVGQLPVAHYMAYKASHNLHGQLALRLDTILRFP